MNNFTIDGVEDNELFFDFAAINPPPDALREFNVQTNMSSGQYGRRGRSQCQHRNAGTAEINSTAISLGIPSQYGPGCAKLISAALRC